MILKKTLADITADTKLLKRQIVETASEGKEVFQELKDDMQDTLSNWKQDISQNKRHIEKEILDIQKSIEKLQEAVPEKSVNKFLLSFLHITNIFYIN